MLLKPKIIIASSIHFTRVLEDPNKGICARCSRHDDCHNIKIRDKKLSHYCFLQGIINSVRSNLYNNQGLKWNYFVE